MKEFWAGFRYSLPTLYEIGCWVSNTITICSVVLVLIGLFFGFINIIKGILL